jgi:2-(1,2-epoxy-1,2-dihydrophenyl)acetyl-CoA isomerase
VTGAAAPAVARHGRVLRCVVTDAARRSTLDFAAVREVTAALRGLGRGTPAPDVGAVLLVGEGANFCTGADVAAFATEGPRASAGGERERGGSRPPDTAPDLGDTVRALAGDLHDLVRAVVAAPVPVVAAVHGWAAGAGMSLVLAADLAVAGTSTRLRPAYPAIGLTADGGLTWTLPRAVGPARARHILLTDRVLSAADALALGLVAAVVPDDAVVAEARQRAERLADGPTAALGRVKRLLHEGAARDLDAQLDAEADAIAASAAGPEGREGVAAFLDRRAPRFPR